MPVEVMADIVEESEPAFVPVMVGLDEDKKPADGIIAIELGDGLVMRVPGNVAEERVAALVRALRSAS